MFRTAIASLLCLLLSACFISRAQSNQPLAAASFEQLVIGTSTSSDAARLLGAPNQVVELGTGSAWHYQYGRAKRTGLFLILVGLLNEDAQSDRIWLFFDESGKLTQAAGSFEADRAEWELP